MTAIDAPERRMAADKPLGPAAPGRHHKRRPLALLRVLVLFGFAVFCAVPLIWLLLAPTKTNNQMLTGNPLASGRCTRSRSPGSASAS